MAVIIGGVKYLGIISSVVCRRRHLRLRLIQKIGAAQAVYQRAVELVRVKGLRILRSRCGLPRRCFRLFLLRDQLLPIGLRVVRQRLIIQRVTAVQQHIQIPVRIDRKADRQRRTPVLRRVGKIPVAALHHRGVSRRPVRRTSGPKCFLHLRHGRERRVPDRPIGRRHGRRALLRGERRFVVLPCRLSGQRHSAAQHSRRQNPGKQTSHPSVRSHSCISFFLHRHSGFRCAMRLAPSWRKMPEMAQQRSLCRTPALCHL